MLLLSFFFQIKSQKPPTPPSPSTNQTEQPSYRDVFVKLLTNKQYWLLTVYSSLGVGTYSMFLSKSEQMYCTLGYSTEFTGALVSTFTVSGIIGSHLMVRLMVWKPKPVLYVKINIIIQFIAFAAFTFVEIPSGPIGKPFTQILYVILGVSFVSIYPAVILLVSDVVFPLPEFIPLAVNNLLSLTLSGVVVALDNVFNTKLDDSLEDVQLCWDPETSAGVEPRNYLYYKLFFFGYAGVVFPMVLLFFNPKLVRLQ